MYPGTSTELDPTRSLWLFLDPLEYARVNAKIIDLRWGYSSRPLAYKAFDTLDAAAACAGSDSFVEEVTLRNPDGTSFLYGRLLASPNQALHTGATVQRVWYTLRQGMGGPRADVIQGDDDVEYEDFEEVPRHPRALNTIVEHLRFQDGTRVVDTEARYTLASFGTA